MKRVGSRQRGESRGDRPGMWIFSILGFLGLLFAFLLGQREAGPYGHGLETIKPGD